MNLIPTMLPSRLQNHAPRSWIGIDELFNELVNSANGDVIGQGRGFPMDVEELDDKYIIQADIPGVDKSDINITVLDRLLSVQVKNSCSEEKKEKNYVCCERRSGLATRSITLPLAADENDVDAKLKDGVLTLTVKKQPEAKTKQIKIN